MGLKAACARPVPTCETVLYTADFESGADGWVDGASTCTTGSFVQGTPDGVNNGGVQTQVSGASVGTGAWFTQPNTGGAGIDDVDGGICETLSPSVDGGGATVTVMLDYFHGQRDTGDDPSDGFSIEVLNDGVVAATIAAGGDTTQNAAWTWGWATIEDAGSIRLRVRAADGAAAGDLVEAGVDNVRICSSEDVVTRSLDLWETPPGGGEIALDVPQGFFCDGSAAIPLGEPHSLKGRPLVTSPPGVLGGTDTVIERVVDGAFVNDVARTGLFIRALSMESETPLTVTCTSAPTERQYNVEVFLDGEQQPGEIVIDRGTGTFDACFPVDATIVFVNVVDPLERLPIPPGGEPPEVTISTTGAPWIPTGPNHLRYCDPVTVDSNGDGIAGGADFSSAQGNCGNFFPAGPTTHDDHSPHRTTSPTPPPPPPPCTVVDDFESGAAGWSNSTVSTCSAGAYVLGNPTQVVDGGVTTQVGGSNSGVSSIFTATNSSAGVDDVDGGNCILDSPTWSVGAASTLSVAWWHGQRDAGDDPSGDFFLLEYSTNGGSSWNTLTSNGDAISNAAWSTATAQVPGGSSVQLRVQCSDGAGPGDLVECGIDDVSICPN